MPLYRIQTGGRFRQADGTVAEAGDEIELPEDVAAMHTPILQRITGPVTDPAPAQPQPEA